MKIIDRLPKNKRLTLDNNKHGKAGDKQLSQSQMEGAGLAAVIQLAEGTGALTLKVVLQHRVTVECLSSMLTDLCGVLQRANSSVLYALILSLRNQHSTTV